MNVPNPPSPIASTLLALSVAFAALSVDAGTFRCQASDGTAVFAQYGCPAGTEPVANSAPRSAAASGSFSVIETPELTDAEQQRLESLARRAAIEGKARARQHEKSRRTRSAARESARERCQAALERLDDLAGARRRGYSAAEDRRWDAEEARLKATRRRDC